MGIARDGVLAPLVALALEDDPTLTSDWLGDPNRAVDLRDHCRVARLARLEQLDHARKAPVMSLVLDISRGIFASTSPGASFLPSSTLRWDPIGNW